MGIDIVAVPPSRGAPASRVALQRRKEAREKEATRGSRGSGTHTETAG